MSYVELRCKTNFSFLTGASHPDELVLQALAQGLYGLALTDLNGVYAMPKGYKVSKLHPQFKYICGTEFSFSDHPNLTVLTKTRASYGRICNVLTQSKRGHQKGEGQLQLAQFLDLLAPKHARDLIVIPRLEGSVQFEALKQKFAANVYLPLTFYQDGKDKQRVAQILEWQKKFDLELIASNDVEYHVKQRKIVQDVLISIREAKPLNEVGFKLRGNGERYLKSGDQMRRIYKEFPEALNQTLWVAEECTFCPSELKYRYPSEWIPDGFSAQEYLEKLVWQNAPIIYKGQISERAQRQLKHELKLIGELNYADYFLTIYDVVFYARSRQILCQGRGSAANSAVCYVLGITAIDPVQMDLLFERFISAERGEPPDIDIDFEHERREEVIQYIYEKYGRHRAAMVSAVVTYQYRNAFREVCKAFGVPVGTLSAKKVEKQFTDLTKDLPGADKLRLKIDSVANELRGFPRHLSIHSGGFTLSADPITDIVPVEPARMPGRTIIQWDKYDLDILGLIKVDVLALGMLTCLSKALKMIGKQLHEIPHDDKKTYQMIQRCETVGTFQIESRAQMSMLGRLKPQNFYDLVIEVAIVRPGPIVGKMIHPYLRRRKGLEKVDFPNEMVRQILGRTLGVPLFQEQIMKLAIDLANFTPGEADLLRKSINAWRSSAPIEVMAKRLMQGLLKGGMTQAFANQIFEQIQGFSHYGFPESHAASFALIAYVSCYLKCHHPTEFACALVNSQPMGFYRPDTILYEAIRCGAKVLPVSVLHSDWDCQLVSPLTIRLGFKLVNGVAQKDVEDLIDERKKNQFLSLADFMKRSSLRSDVLKRFSLAGRFEEFNWSARDSLWAILEYQNLLTDKSEAQLSFFTDSNYLNEVEVQQETKGDFKNLNNFEKIQNEYKAFSLSLSGHPMQELRKNVPRVPPLTSKVMRQLNSGRKIRIAGLVLIRQKPPTAKGTCFCTLEDEFGFVDLVLFPKVFQKYADVFLNHCFIIIEGTLEKDGNTVSVIVRHVEGVWQTADMEQTPLAIAPTQYFY